MHESSDAASVHYFQALNRYMTGLENGDLEAVATLLHEAENDARLEQMLLEIHAAYQTEDHTQPQSSEIAEARDILHAIATTHFLENSDVPVTSESYKMSIHTMSPEATGQNPTRTRRISAFVQMLAAVLVVALLSVGSIALFASRHAQTGSSVSATSQRTTVAITRNGTIIAFEATTGKALWKYNTEQSIVNDEAGLIIKDQVLYALNSGHVYALHLTDGALLWQSKVPFIPPTYLAFGTRFVLDQGILYIAETGSQQQQQAGPVVGFYGKLYALRASNGKSLWTYKSNLFPLLDARNGVVHVVNQKNNSDELIVQELRGTDGTVLWSKNYNDSRIVVGSDDTLYTISNPTNSGKVTLQATRKDGSVIWSRSADYNAMGNAYVNKTLLIYGVGSNFCAYELDNGSQQWCTNTNDTHQVSTYPNATLTNSTLYYVTASTNANVSNTDTNSATIAARRVSDGKILWSKQYSATGLASQEPIQPVIADNMVVINLTSGIYVLNASNGHELWHINLSDISYITVG